MNEELLKQLLENIKNGTTPVDEAVGKIKNFTFSELGYAKIDHHRQLRTGLPEVVFGSGKTTEHIVGIVQNLLNYGNNILVTRVTRDVYNEVKLVAPDAVYDDLSRAIRIVLNPKKKVETQIAVITAGTSDIPVAEEAAVTAEIFGNEVVRLFDVGVAGVHRLFHSWEQVEKARVFVVVAGMEGALPSVVGGLVDKPVIAVPTSVGYGAAFGGVAALLGMLTSCASGVSVVNIDNGFGAGYMASVINQL